MTEKHILNKETAKAWLTLVLDLVRKTRAEEILWRPISPIVELLEPGDKVSLMYETNFEGTRLLLFKKNKMVEVLRKADHDKPKRFYDPIYLLRESIPDPSAEYINVNKTETQIVLLVADENNAAWEVPHFPATDDLYDLVKYMTSGADDLYKKYRAKFRKEFY